MVIKIVKDEEAFKLLSSKEFISTLDKLSSKDKKATVIQEPPFVLPWYFQYSNRYKPILILGYNGSNQLVGFMPLAFSIKGEYLTHAGDGQAEYHGWISREDAEQNFPIQTLIAIKNTINLNKWQWRWIPPRANTDWIHSKLLAKENIYVKYKKQKFPILDLKNTTKLKKVMTYKSINTDIDLYKKKGDLHLEKIMNKDEASKLFDKLAEQYDILQEVAHQVASFTNDNNKKEFYINRMSYPKSIHFSILWSNNIPIAFHFGACDSNTVYFGLASYSLLESKKYPGTILLIKLAEMLSEEGYHYFDLTSGGDEYKEILSYGYQELIMPTFYFGKKAKIQADLLNLSKKIAKLLIYSLGLPKDFVKYKKSKINVLRKRLRNITLFKVFKKILSIVYEKRIYVYNKISFNEFDLNDIPKTEYINIQKLSDFLLYTGSNPSLTKSDLLSEAVKRISHGETLYTITKDGLLAHYGWMTPGGKTHRFTEVDMEFNSPPGSVILYDFYTDPKFRRQGFYKQNLNKMLYDSFNAGAKDVFIGYAYKNYASKTAIEKVGFKTFRIFIKKRLFWLVKKEEK